VKLIADKPLILVTNDDGYDAPGLAALVEAVEPLGRILVVAPDQEQSGAGHALTLDRPLRVYRVEENRYRVTGTPTDCVHIAVTNLSGGEQPSMVVSGINRGLNIGDDVTYSGTVSAALEGTLLGIPSIAFSVQIDFEGVAHYDSAVPFAGKMAGLVLERGMSPGVLLNVNFPKDEYRGVRITRQGTRTYSGTTLERVDPSGRPYFWIAGARLKPAGEPDGDHEAIDAGFISVTPLQADMTHEPSMVVLSEWKLEGGLK
jgi:5'-nucleotidase